MIANPTPITAATFSGMWITNLGIFLPTVAKPKGFIGGNFLPCDGTHLLAAGGKRLFVGDLAAKLTTDTSLNTVLTALVAEAKSLAATTAEPEVIQLNAPDPSQPVSARVMFVGGAAHTIPDCYALAATDAAFAGVFQATMVEIARQAGLTVTA